MPKMQIYADRAGQYRWRLLAANNEIIATSGEGYVTKQGATLAAQRVQLLAPRALLQDLTLPVKRWI